MCNRPGCNCTRNPANDRVRVNWPQGTPLNSSWSLVAPDGRVVLSGRTTAQDENLDIRSAATGAYVLRLETNTAISSVTLLSPPPVKLGTLHLPLPHSCSARSLLPRFPWSSTRHRMRPVANHLVTSLQRFLAERLHSLINGAMEPPPRSSNSFHPASIP